VGTVEHRRLKPLAVTLAMLLLLSWAGSIAWAFLSLSPPLQVEWEREVNDLAVDVEWSPNGWRLAVAASYDGVYVYDWKGFLSWHKIPVIDGAGQPVRDVAWSPDSQYLAAASTTSVVVYSMAGDEVWRAARDARLVAWSPDGRYLAVAGLESLAVYSVDGRLVWSRALDGEARALAWSPGGDLLALGTSGGLQVYTSAGRLAWTHNPGSVYMIAWSPSGYKLAVAAGSSGVFLYTKEGEYLWAYDPGDTVSCAAWNSAGTAIAVAANKDGAVLLDVYGNLVWKRVDATVGCVSWMPGKDLFLAVGDQALLYDTRGTLLWNHTLGDWVWSVSWAPSSEQAALGVGSSVRVLDLGIGFIVISAPEQVLLTVAGGGGSTLVNVQPGEESIVYVSPGTYQVIVHYNDIGKPITLEVSVDKAEVAYLDVPPKSKVTGTLIIRGAPGAEVNVSWTGGMVTDQIPQSGELSYTASEGLYQVSIRYRTDVGGDIEVRETVTVEAGSRVIVDSPVPGAIWISGPHGAQVRISWAGYSKVFTLQGELTLTAAPGIYTYEFVIPVPADKPYVGQEPGDSGTLIVRDGATVLLSLPSWLDMVGRLIITGPHGAAVTVSWMGGERSEVLPASEVLEFYAGPGSYTVVAEYPVDVGPMITRKGQIYIVARSEATFEIPLPGILSLSGPEGTNARVSWPGGEKTFVVGQQGILDLEASPGEYNVLLWYEDFWREGQQQFPNIRVEPGRKVEIRLDEDVLHWTDRALVVFAGIAALIAVLIVLYWWFLIPKAQLKGVRALFVKDGVLVFRLTLRNPAIRRWRGKVSVSYEGGTIEEVVTVPGQSTVTVDLAPPEHEHGEEAVQEGSEGAGGEEGGETRP